MKRRMALLAVLTLLFGIAQGETENPAAEAMEQLFAAVSGVRYEEEIKLREDMTEAETQARTAENAEYRASVLPWLKEVFDMKLTDEGSAQNAFAESNLGIMEKIVSLSFAESETEPEAPTWEEQVDKAYEVLQTREIGQEYLLAMEAAAEESGRDAVLTQTREYLEQWLAQVNHEKLKAINKDYLCWLYCADTMVDYPVVQAENNSKYLHKMLNGSYNSSGTLFADYRNLPDFQDPNTLIYGHHMKNGSMFGTLVNYEEQAYYDSHPYWLVMREETIDLIELFAGYTTGRYDHCYDIAISGAADKEKFVAEAKRKSDFDDSGMEILRGDRLVTLSTCAYTFKNARYVAIGKLVPVWEK